MGRFVDAQDVRDWTGDPDLTDERLNLLIPASEDAVEGYCAREFSPTEDQEREFVYDGNGFLTLDPYELRSITTITWDALSVAGTFEDVATSDYRLRGRTKQGTYLWLGLARIRRYGEPLFDPLPRNLSDAVVKITGDWGCATVPSQVITATLIVVTNQLENPSSAAARSVGGVEFQEGTPGGIDSPHIPDDAKGWLEPLRRNPGLGVG